MIEVSWMWSGVSCICWNSIADVQDTPPPPNHPDPWAEEHHFEATIGWSIQMRNRVPTCSNMFQHVPTCSNMFQHVPTCSNMFQHVPTCSNMFQHHAMKTGTLLSPILILDPTCKSDITGTATRSTAQFKISVGSPQTIRCRPMHFKVCRIMLHHDIRCFFALKSKYSKSPRHGLGPAERRMFKKKEHEKSHQPTSP